MTAINVFDTLDMPTNYKPCKKWKSVDCFTSARHVFFSINRRKHLGLLALSTLLLIRSYFEYSDLHDLTVSAHPDTFWHTESNLSIRKAMVNETLSQDFAIVAACGRDVAAALGLFRKNLEAILALFRDYHVLIGESDSTDETPELLRNWSTYNTKIEVRTYENLQSSISNRIHRLAYCRNDLLDAAREKGLLKKAKYLLVIDIDVIANHIFSVENFLSNFKYDTRDWAVMTASQTEAYYDIWALRTRVVDYDCWAIISRFRSAHRKLAHKFFIEVHTKPIPYDHPLIEVRSAFGGFGVYQTRYLDGCRYEGFDSLSKEKCEHLSLHQCVILNGGRIFINPKFQNSVSH